MRLTAPLIACAIAAPVAHAGFAPYTPGFRTVTAPPTATGSFGVAGAALTDGRLLAVTGSDFFVETAVGSGDFALAATLDSSITDGTDPGFLAVSDSGTVALGAGFGRPVVTFDSALFDAASPSVISTGNAGVFSVDHFAGAWRDDDTLALTSSGVVTELDTVSGDTTTLVANIDGASAGVAFDDAGNLYTGNGFDSGPGGTVTGEIRSFSPGEIAGTADFVTDGAFVAELLSASPLHFDGFGNLIAAGGDFGDGDVGYVGVFNPGTGELAQLDPLGTGDAFYSAFVNEATGELIVQSGSDWFVYSVPAPGATALGALGLASAARRRRRAS